MKACGPAHRILLGAVFVSALAVACSGGQPTAKTAEPPPKAAVEAPARTVEAAPPSSTSPGAASAGSVELVASKMAADLQGIGIDLTDPGDLSTMDATKKRRLMPLFVKALGMQNCLGCHVEGNFKADTHNKRMAGAMWSHFVRTLRTKTGAPLFCDSCHQGKQRLLDRSDAKVLSVFMRTNYEDKLERKDHQDHSCETCHSDPFERKIFAQVWKISP